MQPARLDDEIGAPMSVSDHVLARLRTDILSLALVPGLAVSERDLQAGYGASRTPIRQALQQLAHEGLVVRTGRGYAVAPIDVKQLSDIFEYREIVETAAIRLACERAEASDLDAVQAVIDQGLDDPSPETWFRIGTDVHVMLARMSGNACLLAAVQDIVTRIARARWLMVYSEGGRDVSRQEHSELVALVRRRDADAAADAIRLHARTVHNKIMRSVRDGRRHFGVHGIVVKGA